MLDLLKVLKTAILLLWHGLSTWHGLSASPNNNNAVLNILPAFFTWNARGSQQRKGQKPTKKVMFAWQRCGAVTECAIKVLLLDAGELGKDVPIFISASAISAYRHFFSISA